METTDDGRGRVDRARVRMAESYKSKGICGEEKVGDGHHGGDAGQWGDPRPRGEERRDKPSEDKDKADNAQGQAESKVDLQEALRIAGDRIEKDVDDIEMGRSIATDDTRDRLREIDPTPSERRVATPDRKPATKRYACTPQNEPALKVRTMDEGAMKVGY